MFSNSVPIFGHLGASFVNTISNGDRHTSCSMRGCWICWPGPIFLQCPGDTSAGYAGQALHSSSGVRRARRTRAHAAHAARCMHLLFQELHESFTNLRRPYILQCRGETFAAEYAGQACLGGTSAGYAGQALHSSNVWVTPLLDMLARPCIPPMSG